MLNTILEHLKMQNATVAVAESCTGGKICAKLVSLPGVSQFFEEGYVTYANSAKVKNLGVSQETLETSGAVSEECAKQMSAGVAKRANATYGLATTGIAGPDGGTAEKPVGLVYISCTYPNGSKTIRRIFDGSREDIRNSATDAALELLLECLLLKESPCES